MNTFRYLGGTMVGELLLKHADRTLRHKSLSAAEGQRMASMIVKTLKGILGDEQLYLFQTKGTSNAGAIDLGELALPRRKRAFMRFDDRMFERGSTGTAKDLDQSLGIL